MNIALDDDGKSFWVLRLKVRDRIVADGIEDDTFDASNVGNYLKAAEVNAMIDDPDAVFVDMRNHYEYEVGRFDNALEVPADTFRDQLPMAVDMLKDKKDKKIVMYCTGGIRCEKASAWMRHNGFQDVYHVEVGLLNMHVGRGNKIYRCVLKVKTLFLMNAWASVYRMMFWRIVISVVSPAIRTSTASMMVVTYCLYSAKVVPRSMSTAVARCARKKPVCRLKNSVPVGRDVRMVIKSLTSRVAC